MDDSGFFPFYGYFSGESTAGFIYRNGEQQQQRFFPLWPEAAENSPAFLPHNCTVCDSNKGLLLCSNPAPVPAPCLRLRRLSIRRCGKKRRRRRRNLRKSFLRRYSYLVCNPFFRGYRRYVRTPPSGLRPHRACIPRVLVVNRHPTHPGFIFYIVCALPSTTTTTMSTTQYCYSFQVYSSFTDRWRTFHPHAVGHIREDTGVSCGTSAYWLLHDLPLAQFYDTSNDVVGVVELPDAYRDLFWQPDVRFRSQLGKRGDKLCFVVATEKCRALYTDLDDDDDGAGVVKLLCRIERRYPLFCQIPRLSRFQDGRLQVPFWYDNGLLTIWDGRRGGLEPVRTMCLEGPQQRDLGADVLPLVHTDLHPVLQFLLQTDWTL